MAGASAMAMSLTCALYPCRGPCSTPRSLPSTRKKRICTRKRGSTKVTAILELEPPPYPLDALEPHMSKETLEYHWGQHHKGYVETLNTQIAGTEMENMSLRDVLRVSYREGDPLPAFNNAAQVWNHDFFWSSMKPGGGGRPSGDLLQLIERDFGSFEGFLEKFKSAAATQFGSGWAWLAYKANRLCIDDTVYPRPSEDDQRLVVVKSPNAINPLVWDYYPLLGIDVWEHAYYLDFENRRADYTSTFLEKLVSWERVSSRLETAMAEASEREVIDKARELTGKRRRRRKRRRTRKAARKAKKQAQQAKV